MAQAKKQRVIRRMQIGGEDYFDDKTWPVGLAILVLCGFAIGLVSAVFRFDDARFLHNAWTWSATIGLTAGFTLWATTKIESHRYRRTGQLAAVVSLIIHLWFGVALWMMNSPISTESPELVEEKPDPENHAKINILLPSLTDPSTLTKEILKPVESETVQTETVQDERPPEQPNPEKTITPERETTSNRVKRIVHAQKPVELLPDSSVPRRSKHNSKMSRNRPQEHTQAPTVFESPDVKQASRQQPSRLTSETPSKRQSVEKQTQGTPVEAPRASSRAASSSRNNARRVSESPADLASTRTPTMRKRVREPQRVPKSQMVSAPDSASPRRTDNEAITPSDSQRQRRTDATAGQIASVPDAPGATSQSKTITKSESQQRQSTETNDAQTNNDVARNNSRSRQRSETPLPTDIAQPAENPKAIPSAGKTATQLPTDSIVGSKRANTATAGSDASSGVSSPQAGRKTQIATASQQRDASQESTDLPTNRTERTPLRKAPSDAVVAGSPNQAEAPSPAKSEQGVARDRSPTHHATSRSDETAITGAGQNRNFDEGPQARGLAKNVTSTSARRESATQNGPPGADRSPSQKARSRQSIAQADAPAAMQVENNPQGDVAGRKQAAPTDQTASAADRRRDSAQQQSDVSAAAGPSRIDTGPIKIAGSVDVDRAAGGGSPIPKSGTPHKQISKRASGGDPIAALDAARAIMPAAPQATGSGRPTAAKVANDTLSRDRSRVGGAAGSAEPGGLPDGKNGRPRQSDTNKIVGGVSSQRAQSEGGAPSVGQQGRAGRIPRKSSQEVTIEAPAIAKAPIPGGAKPSSGETTATPSDVVGLTDKRTSDALAGQSKDHPTGAAPASETRDSRRVVNQGSFSGRAESSEEAELGVALRTAAGGRRRNKNQSGVEAGMVSQADLPDLATSAISAGDGETAIPDSQDDDSNRRSQGGVNANLNAVAGPGGIGDKRSDVAGIDSRRAHDRSEELSPTRTRFQRRTVSGEVPIKSEKVRVASGSFAGRRRREYADQEVQGTGQSGSKTEESIESGLRFLAAHQSADGSWSLHAFPNATESDAGSIKSDTAATGLVLLSFLGADYTHYNDQYEEVVDRGLKWLVAHQNAETGDLYVSSERDTQQRAFARFYSHAIATMALCEAYGKTGDLRLRGPAQKAVDFVSQTQDAKWGGWRYARNDDTDTSVTGWMLTALKSAERAKLRVSPKSYSKILKWLDKAQLPGDGSRYRYRPHAEITKKNIYGKKPTPSMTSVGLLMRLYLGWQPDHPHVVSGADYVLENLPSLGMKNENQSNRDTYYWYYATQVLFHVGGDRWTRWWENNLRPMLIRTQIQQGRLAGSWHPQAHEGIARDQYAKEGGRIYVTTMNLLSLEVKYRYLPLYKDVGK